MAKPNHTLPRPHPAPPRPAPRQLQGSSRTKDQEKNLSLKVPETQGFLSIMFMINLPRLKNALNIVGTQ